MSFINNSKPNLDGSKGYDTHTEDYTDKERLGDNGPTYDSARTTRLLRKMDINIVPFLALLYLCVMFWLLHVTSHT